jgi:hypothetical protein
MLTKATMYRTVATKSVSGKYINSTRHVVTEDKLDINA